MALEKILRTHQVLDATGLTRATLYRYMAAGTFPLPIQLGPQSRGWSEEAVKAWLASRARGVDSPAGRRLRVVPRRQPAA
jgi:prophage regulatory protein